MGFDFDRHQRSMSIGFRLFMVVWVVIFFAIISVWGIVGYGMYKGVTDPNASQALGKAVGGFIKGVNDGQK